jgi:DNA-binding Lrp family transcriptional regulator
MDAVDRRIVNALQGGFPVAETPFAEAATALDIDEDDLIRRVERLCADGWLSRFGPMYNADRLGGATTLAAMAVPEADFDAIADKINAHPEIAHNYARNHALNMWFVIATETPGRIDSIIDEIERETGLRIYDMPKIEEFFVGLRFEA